MRHRILIIIFAISSIALPKQHPIIFDVKDFGARGNGIALDTPAIQKAIDACSRAGKGTVLFPKGTYKAGTIYLKSNIRIYLATGAVLLQSKNMKDYDIPLEECYVFQTGSKYVFLHGNRVNNVTIEGPGIIDGNRAYDADGKRGPIPILFENAQDILVKDFTVQNSPGWSVSFFGCNHVNIIQVKCLNSYADGINITCCQNVLYDGVYIEGTRDDPICIKNESRDYSYDTRPDCGFLTENVVIANCIIKNCPHPAFKIGTGTAGIFRKIIINNCIFENTGSMFTIQLMRPTFKETRERVIEDILISNIIARNVKDVFDITTMGVNESVIRNISFNQILVDELKRPSRICGTVEAPIHDISISNLKVIHKGKALTHWLKTKHVHGLNLNHIELDFSQNVESALIFENGRELEWNDINVKGLSGNQPVIKLAQTDGAFIHNSFSPKVEKFLSVTGQKSRNIHLLANDISQAKHPISASADVPADAFYPFIKQVDVLDFQVSDEILPNTSFQPSFTLHNGDVEGAYYASVYVNQQLAGSKWLWLKKNQMLRDSLSTVRFYKPGKREIRMGPIIKSVKVKKTDAQFVLGDTMEIVSPAASGQLTWVKVTVKNIGGSKGSYRVEMLANDKLVASKNITLGPGESKVAKLEYKFRKAGSNTIKVGDFPVWSFTTYTNTNARFFQTKEGQIIIDAGGRRNHFEDYAVVYFNNIEGDYTATVRVLYQDPTTGSNAAVGVIARNEITDATSGGLNLHYRKPKYGGYKVWRVDSDGDGIVDSRSDGGYAQLPVWFKLTKRGKTFRAFTSLDGKNWRENKNHFTLDHADEIQDVGVYGFASSSAGKVCRVVFKHFKVKN